MYNISSIGDVVVKAEVYTRSTDSWVEIDVILGRVNYAEHLSWHKFYGMMPVYQNGVFYWMAGSSSAVRVVSFDISVGFYDEINIPTHVLDLGKNSWTIVYFKEEISLIICNDSREFNVWALNANKNSWTWKLRVDNIPAVARPFGNVKSTVTMLGYKSNGELLVQDRWGTDIMLLLYDLNSGESKFLPFLNNFHCTEFHFYTESLRPVKALNEE